jgi:hypothetical protein
LLFPLDSLPLPSKPSQYIACALAHLLKAGADSVKGTGVYMYTQ